MPTVSQYYGILGPVPFVDVEISRDNRLFLDACAIRLQDSPQPFARLANRAMASFFLEVARCAMSSYSADRDRGLDLLQHFSEPRETRLGMAANGINGHGGALDVGSWIWKSLTEEAEVLLRLGLLQEIEALPLFVSGVGNDITSDLTTRIVYEALAAFTAATVAKYPEFRAERRRVESAVRQVWDVDRLEWSSNVLDLPVADGKPLLLVPRNWARRGLLMTADRYYGTTVLSYAQNEQTVVMPTGKLLKPSKDVLKTQASLARGRITNLGVTLRATTNSVDLIAAFKAFVDSRYERPEEQDSAA